MVILGSGPFQQIVKLSSVSDESSLTASSFKAAYAHYLASVFNNNHSLYLHPFYLGNVFLSSLDLDETFLLSPYCWRPSLVEIISNVNAGSELLGSSYILKPCMSLA